MFIVSISGVIGWDVTPDSVRNQLKEAKGDILVEIGSPGGFVYDGLEIFNIIRDYKGGKVTTKLMGIAASMASYIALAGETVTAHDNAIYMIHNAMSFSVGNQNDMRETADHLEKLSNHLAKAYVKKTGRSLAEIKKMMDEETWLYGDEMVEAGFVDSIIETENDSDKDSAMVEAKAKFANCKDQLSESFQKDDLKKAAASISTIIAPQNKKTDILPATPEIVNKKNKEENTMKTLEEFLAENPGATTAYKKAIETAEKKGEDKITARIKSASPYLNNKSYPTLAELALQVVNGEAEAVALTASVSAIDAAGAKIESDEAKKETDEKKETKGEQDESPELSVDGSVNNDADFDASMKRLGN